MSALHPALAPYRRNYTPAPAPVSIFTNPTRGPLAPADADPTRTLLARATGPGTEGAAVYAPLRADGHRADPRQITPGQGLTLGANDPAAIRGARARGARQGLAVRSSRFAMAQMRPAATAAANLDKGRGRKANSPGGLAITHLRKTGQALTSEELIRALDLPGDPGLRNRLSAYLASYVQRGKLGRFLDDHRRARYYDLAAAPAPVAATPEARP